MLMGMFNGVVLKKCYIKFDDKVEVFEEGIIVFDDKALRSGDSDKSFFMMY